MEKNVVINEDCLVGIKKLPDCCVDLVITDPPYGDGTCYGRNDKVIENNDDPLINCSIFAELWRVMKNNTVLWNFTNWKHYPFLLNYVKSYTKFKVRHLVVWKKGNFGMGYGFRNQYELILVLEKGKPEYLNAGFSNVQETAVLLHDDSHPHEKPERLIRRMIEHTSKNKGDLVAGGLLVAGWVLKK